MKEITVAEKYPVLTIDIEKSETTLKNVDEILTFLKENIESHPVAVYISEFDHYSHTKSLENGEVSSDIKAAKNIIFCFGKMLPNAQVMGVRPRSIGVVELEDKFTISFLIAPNPDANKAMKNWVESVANKL